MNIDTILRLLKNSGFRVLDANDAFIQLEDPSCILRSFEVFLDYAWIAITFITGLLLFGWAISMIRGAKNDIFTNLKNLTIIFGILTATKPIVNLIWGGDLFARGCKTISVSTVEVRRLLDARNLKLAERNESDLFEEFNIYDSAATAGLDMPNEIPYASAPLVSAGDTERVTVTVSGDNYTTGAVGQNPLNAASTPMQNNAQRPTSAIASNGDVIYRNQDGDQYKKTGGSRAWLNNNPGNIRYSEFSRRQGAIGEAGGFSVFPDESTGMAAIKALLQTKNYYRLTVSSAISRYAPPVENNTAGYQKRMAELTGIDITTPMNQLTDTQLQRVTIAIREIEGWKTGREILI